MMATTVEHEHQVLRYRTKQRIVHALLATSFVVLLLTGLVLLWDPLGWLAAGGWSRLIHRIGAIGFLAVPAAYLILDRKGARELVYDSFRYDRDDIEWFKTMYRYFLGHAVEMPPQGRLNAGQKLHQRPLVRGAVAGRRVRSAGAEQPELAEVRIEGPLHDRSRPGDNRSHLSERW